MQTYEQEFQTEQAYLQKVTDLAQARLVSQQEQAIKEKKKLVELNRLMYENTVHFSHDFDKLTEANQELGNIEARTINYRMLAKRLRMYEHMIDMPYFARIDFTEDGYDREPIYIGTGSLTDEDGLDAYVYDWRAPVSSLFYRCEPGRVSYRSPSGDIKGEMNLKRQYEIKHGKLNYFFDCSVNVVDDILRSVLSKNASPKMKTIVETIQREQDVIIRDLNSDLLMVQGVAGSGKTSVALHRVAFLMYEGLTGGLAANNIIILSPNALFGKYISGVLPELGEENIATKTFETIFEDYFGTHITIKSRNSTLEQLVSDGDKKQQALLKESLEFQLSSDFCEILNRFIAYYERSLLDIPDIYYGGKCLVTRQALREELLHSRVNMPVAKRLRIIEEKLFEKLHKAKKTRLAQLEKFVLDHPEHQFEVKAQARLLSIKEITVLAHKIRTFTRINVLSVYKELVADKELFCRIAGDIKLPEHIDELLDFISKNLRSNAVGYAEGMALLYLQVKMLGVKPHSNIKQVVIDEAQDYYSMHYRILSTILPNARYTILGDVNQTIAKQADLTLYEEIKSTLSKRKNTLATMNKSFRCSTEISEFSRRFIDSDTRQQSFDRHEQEPEIRSAKTVPQLDAQLLNDIAVCKEQGFGSLAVLCKSFAQAHELYHRISDKADLRLVGEYTEDIGLGTYILPIYMAKGLEFDAAFVYGTDSDAYVTEDDRKLLYVASTRPLHRLYLYHTGKLSKLIEE